MKIQHPYPSLTSNDEDSTSISSWRAKLNDNDVSAAQEEQSVSEKLIDAEDIMAGFGEGQSTVRVIVNLSVPMQVRAKTNFKNANSLAVLQKEVARRQSAVLSILAGNEFGLRNRYKNQAGFSGEVTARGLDKLLNNPRVESIEPVRILEAHLAQGIPLMNASASRSSYNGAGIAIAICDTGIDYSHPKLGNGSFPNSKVLGGYDFGDNDADPFPCQGHGTACAGLAAGDLGSTGDYIGGVAYNAKLYALKISGGCTGSATSDDMVAAWDWCVTHKNDDPCNPIMVISTSFGGSRYFNTSSCDSATPSMTTAADNAVAAGITVLASSGNDGYCDSMGWPACISSVMSTGAVYDAAFGTYYPCVNANSCATKILDLGCPTFYYAIDETAADMVTSYSNTATFLDLFAPSNQAYTTDIAGSGGYSTGDYMSTFGGTSAACPYTAGAVACLQQAALELTGSYLSPEHVRSTLAATGDPLTDGKVPAITKPRVDLGDAIAGIVPCPGQVLRIYNDGSITLNVNSITKPSWVTLSPAPPYNIPAGQNQPVCVEVDCNDCAGSALSERLLVYSNDPNDSPYPDGVYIYVNCLLCNTPVITDHPDSQTVCEGASVQFCATATGASSFQWKKNGSNVPGATSSCYTINPVTTAAAGNYSCVVSNSCGSVESNLATLTVNTAPIITQHPQNVTVFEGQDAVFTVEATGTSPLHYQWKKNGAN
ncbi:MAG: S8 family serine peptidase, partial [Planctomycetota bacterium]